jgi:hypothetical protein
LKCGNSVADAGKRQDLRAGRRKTHFHSAPSTNRIESYNTGNGIEAVKRMASWPADASKKLLKAWRQKKKDFLSFALARLSARTHNNTASHQRICLNLVNLLNKQQRSKVTIARARCMRVAFVCFYKKQIHRKQMPAAHAPLSFHCPAMTRH